MHIAESWVADGRESPWPASWGAWACSFITSRITSRVKAVNKVRELYPPGIDVLARVRRFGASWKVSPSLSRPSSRRSSTHSASFCLFLLLLKCFLLFAYTIIVPSSFSQFSFLFIVLVVLLTCNYSLYCHLYRLEVMQYSDVFFVGDMFFQTCYVPNSAY